jgi:hypothetical protein
MLMMSKPKEQSSTPPPKSAHPENPRHRANQQASSIGNRVLYRMLGPSTPTLQRKCGCDGSSEQCESCSGDSDLHRAATASQPSGGVPPIVHDVIGSGGHPLEPSTRSYFENRFGHDFGAVRIHTDSTAARSAQSVNALAYTVGQHVVFGAGQYAHNTGEGRRVMAHELAHTIQQSSGQNVGSVAPLRISEPSDAAELEASATADRVLEGDSAAPLTPASGQVLHRVPPDDPKTDPKTDPKPAIPDDWLEDPFTIKCPPAPTDKWIKQVVVKQETPQSVTATWTDGSTDTGPCSTGKGHCCVDPAKPEGVTCTEARSRTSDTNCTPITTGAGLPILKKVPDHHGVKLWNEIDSARQIALHAYSPVDGTPLSHGCIRMNDDMACTIWNGSRVGRTMVKIEGFARPMCDHTALQSEWLSDFKMGGRDLSQADGDERGEIIEMRKELNDAFGRKLSVADIQALGVNDIPKCTSTRALPVKPVPVLPPNPYDYR